VNGRLPRVINRGMSERNEEGVVQLVDAGVPADQGLSSLGLLMQLTGTVLGAYAALGFLTFMFALGAADTSVGWAFLMIGTCIARSYLHRTAGTQLLYGAGSLNPDGKVDRFGGVRRYIVFASSQSLAVGALAAAKFGVEPKIAIAITLALLLWPATLFVLFQLPRFKRFKLDLPLGEDKGFEGTSILMTVLGMCGLLAGGTVLLAMLEISSVLQGAGVLVVLGIGTLIVRSVLHVQAGVSGLRETSVDRSVELANRYANFGVICSFCVGGAMLIFVMGLAANVAALGLIACVVVMLMAWPLIVRRFYSERQFADLLAGDAAPLHRRAPDAGLTSLGWLLFAHAVYSAAFVIIGFAAVDANPLFDRMMTISGLSGLHSIWFSVGLVVLQAWAGFELIRMSPQSRVIATVFGVVGTAVTLYTNWPVIESMRSLRFFSADTLTALGPLAIQIVIPVLTVVIVNRKIAPTARARFRTTPAAT
jgi:hypothetical protein